MRRVVITGMGVVSPLGIGVDPFWAAPCRGESGIRRITRFDPSPFPRQIAGEVLGFDPLDHLPRRDVVRTDLPGFLPNMATGWVLLRSGARGPIAAPTTACAA